jgi:rhodanese-related sulfurtransferase
MESVAAEELLNRVRAGEVTVLDVPPAEEYRAAHLPGAISIPVADLKARLKELPKDREVVAYCRGPYCVMAIEAVELLRKKASRPTASNRASLTGAPADGASIAQPRPMIRRAPILPPTVARPSATE